MEGMEEDVGYDRFVGVIGSSTDMLYGRDRGFVNARLEEASHPTGDIKK